ncbi:hypothetical protein QTP70_012890 [Hemibagrus guttatus]|uniref:Uncharacterized protein n=1 Tax=Hemibagrus guttatus TaxID=175788 RepID=A0AAE0R1W1_9TELE|nr:hypothetical protein QTP70_012890 [Hemibagrus guttatus]
MVVPRNLSDSTVGTVLFMMVSGGSAGVFLTLYHCDEQKSIVIMHRGVSHNSRRPACIEVTDPFVCAKLTLVDPNAETCIDSGFNPALNEAQKHCSLQEAYRAYSSEEKKKKKTTDTATARNLGVTMDNQLSFSSHVTNVTRSCLPLNAIRPLQMIQNAAARLVFNLPKFSHTTPLLRSLHWLLVAARIRFKTLMLAYKAKNGPAPSYLKALVTPRTAPRSLRSTSTARLVPPSLREKAESNYDLDDETELEELSEPEFSHRADCARISTNKVPAGIKQIQKQISGIGLHPFFSLTLKNGWLHQKEVKVFLSFSVLRLALPQI